jgi:diguanylate cyclase (GGDEF)-like protein/PAS domain S-box-containing protein
MVSWLILKKIKNLDFTILVLISTIFFIGYTFAYFMLMQNKKIEYERYNKNLYTLKILNNNFDNFVLNSIAFKNYDDIVKKVKKFEEVLNTLKDSFIYKEFQEDLNQEMASIEKNFLLKKEIIEKYKSYKASSLYSFAYAMKLQKELKITYNKEVYEQINEIFFGLLQNYLNYRVDDIDISKKISHLEQTLKTTDNSSVKYFILHAKTLCNGVSNMNLKKEIYINIPLYADIDAYQTSYMLKYKELNKIKKKIYNFMFIFLVLLLVVLLISYLKSLKLKKDLISFKYAVENSDDSIVVTDIKRHIIYVNEAFTQVTGYSKDEAFGQNPSILKSGKMSTEFYKNMNMTLDRGDKWSGEFINRDKDGNVYYEKASITPMFVNEKLNGYLAIKLNVTDYVREKEKVEFLAYHDSLTRLPNRRMMKEVIVKEIEIVKVERVHLDLLFLDLDGFKSINDTLGHNVGDFFLQKIAKKLEKFIDKKNRLFRTGGDEFAILLNYEDEVSPSEKVASQILDLINEPILKDENELTVGVSIGIAKFDILKDDVISLLKHADIAMYEAKRCGKNRFCNYTKVLLVEIEKKMKIKQALRGALKRDEFYVVYQPKYNLDTKEVHGLEALIRWDSPEFGLIPPDYFIPIAEEMQVINNIGIFVLKQACIDFVEVKRKVDTLVSISVNLSPSQLLNIDLLQEFKNIIKNTDIEAKNIGLEITETHIMNNIHKSRDILKDMRDFGFKIIIDDFGTGYSSLSYLKKLPIDSIKIDKSFIDDICIDENDVKIVKAIISIANSFEYKIVAEGIETKAQEELLKNLGVSTGQGYYFSKPKRKEELF